MSNVLLIGKDLPDNNEVAEAITLKNNSVFCSLEKTDDLPENPNISGGEWNKSSVISAHSFIIKAETKLSTINYVIFTFDAAYFASKFNSEKTEDISDSLDTLINQFLFSSSELLKRIDQKKENISVAFYVKEFPSKKDVLLSGKNGPEVQPASTIVACAQKMFESLAESFGTNIQNRSFLKVLLAKNAFGTEFYENEKQSFEWLLDSLEALNNQKNPENLKQACTWNKVGDKIHSGFSLFK